MPCGLGYDIPVRFPQWGEEPVIVGLPYEQLVDLAVDRALAKLGPFAESLMQQAIERAIAQGTSALYAAYKTTAEQYEQEATTTVSKATVAGGLGVAALVGVAAIYWWSRKAR